MEKPNQKITEQPEWIRELTILRNKSERKEASKPPKDLSQLQDAKTDSNI